MALNYHEIARNLHKTAKPTPYRIATVVIDEFALLSYAAFVEPFRAANLLGDQIFYELNYYSPSGGAVKSSAGTTVDTLPFAQASYPIDLVMVIAAADPSSYDDSATLDWIRARAIEGCTIGGVSGGPVILAKAGIMRGQRMTVHWEHADIIGELYPDILLERNIFIIDNDRITCAGGTAPLDLTHELIRRHHGDDFAKSIDDWFIYTDVRPASLEQREDIISRFGSTNPHVILAIHLMEQHVANPLNLYQIARRTNISPRQLNRIFANTFDRTTMAFYRDVRLEKASNLLRHAAVNITDIALATGFASAAHFSSAFKGRYGQTPSAVRAKKMTPPRVPK